MFQNVIYAVNNQSSNDKFVPEKPNKGGPENHNKEYQSREFFRNRRHQIINTEHHAPDDPNRDGKRSNNDQSLDEGPYK